jgi:general secretion pathway protein F
MTAFDYLALDDSGRTLKGVVRAPDEAGARRTLERRRLTPVRVAPAPPASAARGRAEAQGGLRLASKDLALVTRQLATLIVVAPLEEALRTLALQAEKPRVKRVLSSTHSVVLEGFRLSDAMGRQGRAFPPLYRAMVAAGESSGALPEILERLADLQEREQQVRSKVTTALVYPAMLALVAIVVVIALMTFVVPKVVDQFADMGQTLPLLTRVVIFISELMRGAGWVILLALAGGAAAFAQALRRPAFRLKVDRAILRLPLMGRLVRDLNAARLARTLATMTASGLPVLEGLIITARTVENRVLRGAIEDMAASITEGGSLSAAMRRTDVFPPILIYMTQSGENSGRLNVMLSRAADYLQREFDTFTAVALSLLEPAIIILMGGVVATIVLSILLPILQINNLAVG